MFTLTKTSLCIAALSYPTPYLYINNFVGSEALVSLKTIVTLIISFLALLLRAATAKRANLVNL